MKCENCGKGTMKVTRENHQYKESGLPYVTLVDVEIRRCPECGEVEVAIPKVEKLHRAIATALVHKHERFTGEEVRFLRKYLGRSSADFAALVGITATHMSKIENDHDPVSSALDRLIRLLVVATTPVRDYEIDELRDLGTEAKPARIRAKVDDGAWSAHA